MIARGARRRSTCRWSPAAAPGAVEHFAPAVAAGADAVLAASVFHFGELRIGDVKDALRAAGAHRAVTRWSELPGRDQGARHPGSVIRRTRRPTAQRGLALRKRPRLAGMRAMTGMPAASQTEPLATPAPRCRSSQPTYIGWRPSADGPSVTSWPASARSTSPAVIHDRSTTPNPATISGQPRSRCTDLGPSSRHGYRRWSAAPSVRAPRGSARAAEGCSSCGIVCSPRASLASSALARSAGGGARARSGRGTPRPGSPLAAPARPRRAGGRHRASPARPWATKPARPTSRPRACRSAMLRQRGIAAPSAARRRSGPRALLRKNTSPATK